MKWSVDEAKAVGGVKSMEMKKINRKYWLMPVIMFSLMLLWHFNCYASNECEHQYGAVTYIWSSDNQMCTAERKCAICSDVESETTTTMISVTQKKNCTLPELTTYSAKFKNDAFKQQTKENVQTAAAIGHDLEKVAQKNASCTETGYEAYWRCKKCAKLFSDEAGTHEINNPVEINANGHALKKVEKKAPTCTEIGWEAYDTCSHCNYTTYVELPKLNHDLEHHEAKAATCTEIGWEAYDTCKREGCNYTTYKELPALGHEDSNNDHLCDACSTKIIDHSYESKIAREATTTYTGIRIYTCTKCGHSYTEELAKLPSQTNQADQTNQIEPANNGNEKDFIGTVTSVFLNVTDFAAKNFRISFWLMIQMLLKAVMQLW